MRKLRDIAAEITSNWTTINNGAAREALECMKEMDYPDQPFGSDSNGFSVIGSFLSNSVGWRGAEARRIKAELRKMCK